MEIRLTGHKISVTPGMREHVKERLSKYEKYAPRLVESHVLLKKQKYIYEAEITLLAKNLRAFGHGKCADNIFAAIDDAALHVEKQLKKYREKRKEHHKSSGKAVAEVLAAPSRKSSRKSPRIVLEEEGLAKPMQLDEASMQLGVTEEPFIVFRNSGTRKINVMYKRKDGHHGLVEAE